MSTQPRSPVRNTNADVAVVDVDIVDVGVVAVVAVDAVVVVDDDAAVDVVDVVVEVDVVDDVDAVAVGGCESERAACARPECTLLTASVCLCSPARLCGCSWGV